MMWCVCMVLRGVAMVCCGSVVAMPVYFFP